MTAPSNTDSFLMGGGGKSAKFENVGDTVGGRIVSEPEERQQTDFDTGAPLFWDNGDPKNQLVVRVQTELHEDAEDDGIRNFYLKGGFKNPTTQKAVADAIRAAGAPGLRVGGTLTLRLTGFGTPRKPGARPPKFYAAQYLPPVAGAAFLTEPTAAPAAAPPQNDWNTPAPASQPAGQQGPPAAAPPAAPGMVQLPDGSVVTAEVAALLQQVGG